MNAATRRLIVAMPAFPPLSPERLAALRQLIEWERIEVASSYVDSRHFYLENLGYIRRTTRNVDHHRYGKVPTRFFIPTAKGRKISAQKEEDTNGLL